MSKGLEALKQMGGYHLEMGNCICDLPNYTIIEKELKAFEIITKTLPAFVYAITNSKDYQDYSSHYISPIITKEEYDLLKEVLL